MYCNLCSKMNLPPLTCHTLLTTSHIFFYHHMSAVDAEPSIPGSIFIRLFFFWARRASPFCHQPPATPPPPLPARPSPKALWCVTSHRTLKAVKSQFSDKSNLNLSGDTIYRSDRDRAAQVAVILNKHLEANATFVWSVSSAAQVDSPDKDAMRK